MGLITFLIFGLIVGLIARALHPGRDAMGWFMTMLLGIGGSLLGWVVGRAFGLYHSAQGFKPAGFIMSVAGAILLLVIWHFAQRRRGIEQPR
jgi:uncharacterized membrane protein YeaQ/YmgE (transglycosylase-associated protein family)